jgi:hypothetical protein
LMQSYAVLLRRTVANYMSRAITNVTCESALDRVSGKRMARMVTDEWVSLASTDAMMPHAAIPGDIRERLSSSLPKLDLPDTTRQREVIQTRCATRSGVSARVQARPSGRHGHMTASGSALLSHNSRREHFCFVLHVQQSSSVHDRRDKPPHPDIRGTATCIVRPVHA